MAEASWTRRFLASTRGRILSLLRRGGGTVNELAEATGLTDNAVRAHLATLERDGLVRAAGSRPGTRKPNVVYDLTPEAGQVFPKPYATVLAVLLDVLGERLASGEVEEVLRAAGRRVADAFRHRVPGPEPAQRVRQTLAVLEELGGLAEVEEDGGKVFVRGFDCPLGAVAACRPEVCRLAETLLGELLGLPVRERCVPGTPPRCRFEIAVPPEGPRSME